VQRIGSEVELSVRDTGVGFEPADREKLFEKFSRLHTDTGAHAQGTGLGLFIVKRLMQLTGGRVAAHSKGRDQGAVFSVFWPVASSESA
jgi:signal transduction histidine kinase